MNDIPLDVQETVINKTLKRVTEIMTEEDIKEFQRIDREDPSGNAGMYFLMTRVPKFEAILQEELMFVRSESSSSSSVS